MTEKEYKVARCKWDILEAESRLREAQQALIEGFKKGLAEVEQARAMANRDYTRLKGEVERAEIRLGLEKTYLEHAQAEADRDFRG